MLRVYNSITNLKENFECDNTIKWYSCGPTVYDNAHLGHGSTYIAFDIIRRILQDYLHYNVIYHLNITDIDDKIINRANELGVSFSEHAKHYELAFLEDMNKLGILSPSIMTRVSDHIIDLINYIQVLLDKGFAYKSINGKGSIYMDVQEYIRVNKFLPSMTNVCECECNIDNEKKHQNDFVLWKEKKDNEPFWKSPWSEGRPGWHLECSAISNTVFGSTIDIHSGGIDLKFPHHTNEIIQSESYHGNKWVKYFLHSGHLNIAGLKMSKSLKNFITIREFLSKWTSRQLRLFVLINGWNTSFTFSEENMLEIISIDKKIERFLSSEINHKNDITINDIRTKVHEAILDNFNTPIIINLFIDIANTYSNKSVCMHLHKYVYDILYMFGLEYRIKNKEDTYTVKLINETVLFRNMIRKTAISKTSNMKNILELCDNMRKTMLHLNITIEDDNENGKWYIVNDI